MDRGVNLREVRNTNTRASTRAMSRSTLGARTTYPEDDSMATSQEHAAPVLSNRLSSIAGATDSHVAWLRQATNARDAALRILQNRFKDDLEVATQLVSPTKPSAIELQAQYANKLMAAYLAESEKLFELMGRLVRAGLLRAPTSRVPPR